MSQSLCFAVLVVTNLVLLFCLVSLRNSKKDLVPNQMILLENKIVNFEDLLVR
jgi:hypothetical protein